MLITAARRIEITLLILLYSNMIGILFIRHFRFYAVVLIGDNNRPVHIGKAVCFVHRIRRSEYLQHLPGDLAHTYYGMFLIIADVRIFKKAALYNVI